MKHLHLERFDEPARACRCVDGPEPPAPGAGEILIEMTAGPINPAELLLIEGRYASRPALPAHLGIEGAGRVITVGGGVEGFAMGDAVMSLGRHNWAERVCLPVEQVVKLPSGADLLQMSMLKVNPATARLLLRRTVALSAGDWVIQNAANSAVGQLLIQLARAAGIRTVNVVRRDSCVEPLRALGADVVVVDGDGLSARVQDATRDGDIRLGIDAVAGMATQRLAECLAEGATIVNYGLLSGDPCMLAPEQTVFRGITLTGFWLAKWMRDAERAELDSMYAELSAMMIDGRLRIPVEATYTLDDCAAALSHAARTGRSGKILFTPSVRAV